MDAFAIFEGGGAKGLAHVGALKAAEMKGVTPIGVAGASAGSIAAALVAVGYTADELYDPDVQPPGIFPDNLLEFFDQSLWHDMLRLRDDAAHLVAGPAWKVWLRAPLFYLRHRQLLRRLQDERGILSTERFAAWLETRLAAKLRQRGCTPTGPAETVLFRDVPMPLKIITTDLTNQQIKVYSQQDTPDASVAAAVAASSSIPFVFVPRRDGDLELVDGGVVSNFPAWVFDKERQNALEAGPLTPTFGFRLVETAAAEAAPPPSLFAFGSKLLFTGLFGDQQLEYRRVENLHIFPLRVSIGTLDFTLDAAAKRAVYLEGKDGARTSFDRFMGPKRPDEARAFLARLHANLLRVLGKGGIHLRANIVLPIGEERLRVVYTYQMDNDADDRLELSRGGGASGRAMELRDIVVCDLVGASTTFADEWRMTKYQQALVRRTLKSLMSTPIFAPGHEHVPAADRPVLGVLNFDSDDDLLLDFAGEDVQDAAEMYAHHAALFLNS